MVAVLAILLTLILVIGIHEAGHALAALVFKVKIKKISIGFGRPIMQWRTKQGCDWVWALWPLGGYVQLLNSRISAVAPEDDSRCFDKKPIWMRIIILSAGAAANLLTAWCAFIVVFYLGMTYTLPKVNTVQPQSVAAQAGILPGEQFTAIGGHLTPSWQQVGMELVIAWGQKVPATMSLPDLKIKNIILDLSQIKFNAKENSLLAGIGITPDPAAGEGHLRFPALGSAIHHTNQVIVHTLDFFLMVLKQLFSGVIPFSILLGPIGVFAVSIATLTQGIVSFLFFIASLSLAVALVNLLPLPGLDGGSIWYCIIEKIRGKPISIALEVLIYRLVFIAFCLVLVQLVLNDLVRFFHL